MASQNTDNLEAVIKTVVAKIKRFKGQGFGEQNTKANLIDPILQALGWDIHDADEVHREFKPTSKDSPVDYALKIIRKPRLFVEAKGLDENLTDRKWIAQVLGYATVAGVEWCVLADGDEYRFYNANAPLDADEKLFFKLKLSETSEAESGRMLRMLSRSNMEDNRLDVLWEAHFVDRQVRACLLKLFTTFDKRIVRLIRSEAPKLQPKDIVDSIRRLGIRIDPPADLPDAARSPIGPRKVESNTKRSAKLARPARQLKTATKVGVSLTEIIKAGFLKPPLKLFRKYRGTTLTATLNADGTVEFQGTRYSTCSNAAGSARGTITGRPMATNGWSFWQYTDATGKALELAHARSQFLAKAGRPEGG
ncbi:MAG: hypothetical protein NTZ32_22030 [Planctomycetales bacterium]|nr:hypothetical protein [Planctomycetales bacterium]